MPYSLERSSRLAVVALLAAILALSSAPQAFSDAWARDRAAGTREELDPAIRTALAARSAADSATSASVPAPIAAAGTEEFAWGAAALGLAVGAASACLLLGCVTLVSRHGRLRSV